MGTQTSKPLHGDEERRNRFRRPRTPVNNASDETASNTTACSSTTGGDDRTWPCSNCHATVSNQESRCPFCGGIQVKIPRSPPSTSKLNSNLLLERLAATPTTPVARKQMNSSRIQAFLSESATTSTMDYDEDEEEEDDDIVTDLAKEDNGAIMLPQPQQERPTSALSQASSLSQNYNLPRQQNQRRQGQPPSPFIARQLPSPPITGAATSPAFDEYNSADRPPDPVALTLEAAQLRSGTPSPQVVNEKEKRKSKESGAIPAGNAAVTKRKAAGAVSPSGFVEVPKKKMLLPS